MLRTLLASLFALAAFLQACGPDADCEARAHGPGWKAYALSSQGGTRVELRWLPTDVPLRLVRAQLFADGTQGADKRFGKVSGTSFVDTTVAPDTQYFYRLTSMTNPETNADHLCAITVWSARVFTASQAAWSGSGFGEVHPLAMEGKLHLLDRGEHISLLDAADGAHRWSQNWLAHDWLLGATGAPAFVPERRAIVTLEFSAENERSLFFLDAENGETIAKVPRTLPPSIAPIAFDAGNGKTTLALIEGRGEYEPADVLLLANDGSQLWRESLYLGHGFKYEAYYEWGSLVVPPLVMPTPDGERFLLAGRRTLDQDDLPFVSPINAAGKADWTAPGYFSSFARSGAELFAVNVTSVTVFDMSLGSILRSAQYPLSLLPRDAQALVSGQTGATQSLVLTEAAWPKFAEPTSTVVIDATTLTTRWAAEIGRVLELGDADGDGVDDLVALAHTGTSVAAFNGLTGAEMWRFPLTGIAENMSAQEVKVLRLGKPGRPWLAVIERAMYAESARLTVVDGKGDVAVAFDVPVDDFYRFNWRESKDPQARISALPPDRILLQIERSIYVVEVQ